MINTNRIVPVQAIDLISLYGLILKQASANASLAKLEASEIGEFSVTSGSAPLLANEPVKTLDIADGVSTATVYFVPAYDFAGFTVAGTAATVSGTVEADGRTLYKAELATGTVTFTKAGF